MLDQCMETLFHHTLVPLELRRSASGNWHNWQSDSSNRPKGFNVLASLLRVFSFFLSCQSSIWITTNHCTEAPPYSYKYTFKMLEWTSNWVPKSLIQIQPVLFDVSCLSDKKMDQERSTASDSVSSCETKHVALWILWVASCFVWSVIKAEQTAQNQVCVCVRIYTHVLY